jgi:glucose-6-phosphate 1-epimerase
MNLEQVVAPGIGGLPRLVLRAADGARSEIYLHGAHVTSWIPAGGQERLYVSELAEFRPDAAIRGGIPVIFPQFSGRGPLPRHGFARLTTWELASVEENATGAASAVFRLRDSAATHQLWQGRFVADLTVTLAGRRVDVTLAVTNTGTEAFSFTSALHTYLQVDDIHQTTLEGLSGRPYVDQAAGGRTEIQQESALQFGGEVDRIYFDAPTATAVCELARVTDVAMDGFPDLVVWNPGPVRSVSLADLAPDGYRHMLCVEAAVIGAPVDLAPGASWRGTQSLIARS